MALPQAVPYGQIATAGVLRTALQATLEAHLPEVVEVLAVRSGFEPGELLPPRGYVADVDPTLAPDQPLGVVAAPRIAGRPVKRGTGLYEMTWDVGAAVVVPGRTPDVARARCEIYGAAVRACILQHPSLGGLADATRWIDERYEQIGYDTTRSVWAATVVFSVTLEAGVDGFAGPGANPIVEKYITTVVRRDLLTGEAL